MTSICETLRICFRTLKGTSPGIAAETSRTRYEYELVQAGSASDLEGSDGETQKAPGTDGHPFKGPSVYFTVGIVCYHLVCAGIVAVAVLNGWISTDHGGDFAWELWALWQQLCLWTLFVQNLTRCVIMEAWIYFSPVHVQCACVLTNEESKRNLIMSGYSSLDFQ